jgi:galactose mutarotase-like enzyme
MAQVNAELVELRAGDLVASYAPRVGMVCASLRQRGEELLGQRLGLQAYAETGSTFGIPLLHPWANRLESWELDVLGRPVRLEGSRFVRADEHGLPIHGMLAASSRWTVLEHTVDCLRAALDFDEPALLEAFPFPHRLELDVRLQAGGALTTRMTVTPTADLPVPLAFGFHPYLRIPGVARADWEIGLPVRRRLVVDDRGLPTGETEDVEPYAGPLGELTFDDGYDRLEPGRPFWVAGGGRRLEVLFGAGYPVAQVFAPAGQDLICFEPMAAPTNALAGGTAPTVRPGRRAEAEFTVRVVRQPAPGSPSPAA